MSKFKVPTSTRWAIWQAHARKCAYCRNPIGLADLEIDHIIPETLNDGSNNWDRLKAKYGLSQTFNVNSILNLIPVHHHCNSQKSDLLFDPARALYFLEIAKSKELSVRHYETRILFLSRKEQILAAVRSGLESGGIVIADFGSVFADPGAFPISKGLLFMGQVVEGEIRTDAISALLDTPVLFGNQPAIDGIEFVNDTGSSMIIRTCREFRAAKQAGYYASTTFAMKMEVFIDATDSTLEAVGKSQLASISYLNTPYVGVSDMQLLPTALLPIIGPDDGRSVCEPGPVSLREMLRRGELLVKDVSSTRIQFEWRYAGIVLQELLRADLDRDGLEEILVQQYTYAVGGTLGYGSIGVLRRSAPDAMFEYVPKHS